MTDFIFFGSKITVGDRSHKIKICLLLGRKAMINLDSRLKNRDITLMTKIHIVKGVVFPVFMYRCESQTTKKIMTSNPITSWQIDGETMELVTDFILGGSRITADGFAPWKKSYDQPRQHIKKKRYYFAYKDPSSQSYGFSSSHVWM